MKVMKWILYLIIFIMNILTLVLIQTSETPALVAYIFGTIYTLLWVMTKSFCEN